YRSFGIMSIVELIFFLMTKAKHIPKLLQIFRDNGYDGATLSKISKEIGLGKASLYHHFPGGKDEMVEAVLDYLESETEKHILQPLRSNEDVKARFEKMCDGIGNMFDGGKQPCVFAVLLMGSSRNLFHEKVEMLLRSWINAIASILIAEGLDKDLAVERGENAVLMIEGALILSQGLNNVTPFERVIGQLPEQLCQNLSSKSKF
ncbi:MAG: TetR/AcrR family transcriptional regulator, partial [Cyanobacteria bacterium P01_A01_bin.68]